MAWVVKNTRGKNPSGWVVTYNDINGFRRRKVLHCSKKEAELVATEIESKVTRVKMGLEKDYRKNMLIPEAIKHYHSRRSKSDKTIDREYCVYKAFMKFTGPLRIQSISQEIMMEYFKFRKEKNHLSDAGLGIEYRTLKAFFNFLVDQSFISESPLKGIKAPTNRNKPIRFLTLEEIRRLLDAIEDQNIKDMVLIYINTGARAREISKENFSWTDVDFKGRKINLFGKGNKNRSVPMNDTVFEILNRRKKIEKRQAPFVTEYDYMYKRVKAAYLKAGIKNAKIHTLRKTFGSLLVQNGVNIYTTSKLMGHVSVTVTEKHYAALLDENLRDGVQQLDKVLL